MVYNIIMLFIWFLLFSYMTRTSTSLDTLAVGESIQDGETLVSAGGITEVGFFSPGNSTRRYLGVWYKKVSPLTVVWVANRETPLPHNSGVLKLNEKGILQLLNGTNSSTIWSSNISSNAGNNPIAKLLDTGNLVVTNKQETDQDRFFWQSFDYPSDTLMSGMKLGWDLETGLRRFLSSWKSDDDPARGVYTSRVDLSGYPQVIIFKGSDKKIRTGPWNGQYLAGSPGPTPTATQIFVFNEKEVYYEFKLIDRLIFSIFRLIPSSPGQNLFWTSQSSHREVFSTGALDECENYALCGANSVCNIDGNHPTCECLKGYVPKFPKQWNLAFWSNGCIPRNASNCKNGHTEDGFWKYTNMKVPDTSSSWFSKTMNLEECRKSCLRNCSCVAYTNLDIRNGGSGCLLWFNNIVDARKFSQWGQDLYVRVPPSELDQLAATDHGKIKKIVGITVGVVIFGLISFLSVVAIKNPGAARKIYSKHYKNKPRKEDIDLPTFDLSILANATKNFSHNNKLGQGGFGPVYKGTLTDGQEIAVKRLSKMSGQGCGNSKMKWH